MFYTKCFSYYYYSHYPPHHPHFHYHNHHKRHHNDGYYFPGVVGIIAATQGNICRGESIGFGCIPVEDDELSADVNLTAIEADLPLVEDIRNREHYLLWMTAATGCGLLFVFIGSFCVWIATRVLFGANQRSNEGKGCKVVSRTRLLRYCVPV